MKLKQIVVSIENAPGRLYEVTEALGKAGINLRALNLVDTGAFGQLRLLVSDVAKRGASSWSFTSLRTSMMLWPLKSRTSPAAWPGC